MPSGSHGGGHGGHSVGGASFGGGGRSFGGGSRGFGGGHHHRPMRTRPYYFPMFGHTYVIGTARYSRIMSFFIGAVITGVIAVLLLVALGGTNSEIKKITADRDMYLEMIETAKPDQIKQADVTGQSLGEGDKWYITYNIKDDNGSYIWDKEREGYSYMVYTAEQAHEIFRGGKIEVVIDRMPLTEDTDSVPTDYINFKLEDDGSYINAKGSLTMMRIIAGVLGGAAAIFLAVAIVMALSHKQTEEEANAVKEIESAPADVQDKKQYCAYCGGVMDPGQDSCPRCGARAKK